jgi:glycosyltransferase involved in cell wall biosynthesis
MRRVVALTDHAIFTVQIEKISWLAAEPHNATFIPVGPNLPIPLPTHIDAAPPSASLSGVPSVAVFGVTGGAEGVVESQKILAAVRAASLKLGKLRLFVFGRNADSAGLVLREGLRDLPVELSVEGVLEEAQVVERLSSCDVLLFVRGTISSRRSSAIAGIACGLPVIAWSGTETAPPITDAGVVFVAPSENSSVSQEFLNAVLIRVLSDSAYRAELAARSRAAYLEHFSWPAVATRFAALLNPSTR